MSPNSSSGRGRGSRTRLPSPHHHRLLVSSSISIPTLVSLVKFPATYSVTSASSSVQLRGIQATTASLFPYFASLNGGVRPDLSSLAGSPTDAA